MAAGNVAIAGAAAGAGKQPRTAGEASESWCDQNAGHQDTGQADGDEKTNFGPAGVAGESEIYLAANERELKNMNQIIPDRVGGMDVPRQKTASLDISAFQPAQKPRVPATPIAVPQEPTANLQPLHDRVLVRRIEVPASSPIIIPEMAKTKPLRGVVIAVGPGKKGSDGVFRETMVRPGDEVLFTASVDVPYADLVHDGDLVMMAEGDILGVLEEAGKTRGFASRAAGPGPSAPTPSASG